MDTEKQIVEEFAKDMLKKIELRHNRYAPMGWKTMDVKRLITLLGGELAELQEAIKANDKEHIRSEAVDIANYVMFISEL